MRRWQLLFKYDHDDNFSKYGVVEAESYEDALKKEFRFQNWYLSKETANPQKNYHYRMKDAHVEILIYEI